MFERQTMKSKYQTQANLIKPWPERDICTWIWKFYLVKYMRRSCYKDRDNFKHS